MRKTVIQPMDGASAKIDIALIRDERRQIEVVGMTSDALILTIAADAAAAPMIEIPGSGGFDLHPAVVQTLTEGETYQYNVWRRDASGDLEQVATGQLDITNSIAPTGVEVATVFMAEFGQEGGPQVAIVIRRSAWMALPAPDPDAIYIILEDAA